MDILNQYPEFLTILPLILMNNLLFQSLHGYIKHIAGLTNPMRHGFCTIKPSRAV